jgi:hypothetical protein
MTEAGKYIPAGSPAGGRFAHLADAARSQSAAPQAGKVGHAVYWDQEGLMTVARKAGGAGRT